MCRKKLVLFVPLIILTVSACDSSTLTLEAGENGQSGSQEAAIDPDVISSQAPDPSVVNNGLATEPDEPQEASPADPGGTADLADSLTDSPLKQLCLTHPTFSNSGVYQGVLTQPQNDFTRCEYDVTLSFKDPSEFWDEYGFCVQVAEISAIGTQLISDGRDCYDMQQEELSLMWTLDQQYTIDHTDSISIRENFAYPAQAETNGLATYNVIEVPLRNESGVRYELPPGLVRLFLDEDLKYTALYYEGELRKVESE